MADAQATTTKQINVDDLVRLLGAPVTVTESYVFTDGALTHSTNTLVSASSNFGTDVVGKAVTPVSGKIGSGVTVASRTNSTTVVLSASTADGTGLSSAIVGSDSSQPGSTKTVSAPVSQDALNKAIAEYAYLPGEYSPQNAPENLAAFAARAAGVINGTDSYSSGDIQKILAWLLVSEHGAE